MILLFNSMSIHLLLIWLIIAIGITLKLIFQLGVINSLLIMVLFRTGQWRFKRFRSL